jgi:hypothetical protein
MKFIRAMTVAMLAISLVGGASRVSAEQARAFDAERLRGVHDRLLAAYPAERQKALSTFTNLDGFCRRLVTALEDAGVTELVDGPKTGLVPPAFRVAVLNDYGFWLSRTRDPRKAIPILQKVLELAPMCAVAELNLGDAARASLTVTETWAEKGKLVALGLQAYAAYQKLAGKEAPEVAEFQALHTTPSVNENVCSYVAAFYNHGRQVEIWGYPDPVDIAGDGKLRHVYIFDEGTAHIPVIIASTKPVAEESRVTESFKEPPEVDFRGTKGQSTDEEYSGWTELHVLPFKDAYYLVEQEDGGPVVVVKPNAGAICRFKRTFTPVLAEDHAPEICQDAFSGKAFQKIPDAPLPNGEIVPADDNLHLPGADMPHFQRYTDMKLDPQGGPGRIGYYEYAWGGGAGCDAYGVAFLQGQNVEESARAEALNEALSRMADCRGSKAFLVAANGENLIEWDGGSALQRTAPPRTLLRLKGDKVETVCRVEQRPTYITEPVAKPH